jgi:hypothetical protein
MGARTVPCSLVLAAWAGLSCSRTEVGPGGPQEPLPGTALPSSSTVPLPRTPAVALPRPDDRCASDGECGVTSLDLDGPTRCCFRCCSMHGGRRSWVEAFEAMCKSAPSPACTDSACACPSPPYLPKCIDGRCGLVFPPR